MLPTHHYLATMGSKRQIQISETLAHLAADYFARESNRLALITITRADVSPDLKNVTIYFSVLPETYEEQVVHFARRSRKYNACIGVATQQQSESVEEALRRADAAMYAGKRAGRNRVMLAE